MHREWEAHKCGTCAGRLAAPSHSEAFVCFFWTVHSYCFLLFHTIFPIELSSRNTFMTAGSLTNSSASPSMCASLPIINSLKLRLGAFSGLQEIHPFTQLSSIAATGASSFLLCLSSGKSSFQEQCSWPSKQRLCFIWAFSISTVQKQNQKGALWYPY